MKYDFIFESLRQYITAAAPNFVMRDDLVRLEGRIDELCEIAEDLEEGVCQRLGIALPRQRPTADGRRRPPRR
jgi:hypothetical protein